MSDSISSYLWLSLFVVLFLCELYVPYKEKIVIPFLSAFGMTVVYASFNNDLADQCIFSIIASFGIYLFVLLVKFVAKRIQKKNRNCDTVALCDISEKGYGYVYSMGKSYVIKNPYAKKFRKGELIPLTKDELKGEKLV